MNQQQELKKIKHGGMKSLVKRAIELGIKVSIFSPEHSLLKFELNKKVLFTKKGELPMEKRMGDMTRNKSLTKIILSEIGISTSKGFLAMSSNETFRLLKKNKISFPIIIKPVDSSLAKGVTWNIGSKNEIGKAISDLKKVSAFKKTKGFLVEKMFIGDEFRVLVLEKKVISCVKKVPASLIGDGKSTIKQLIKTFDKKRKKGFTIKIDAIAKDTLKKNDLTLSSVLTKDFVLKLRNNLNMSDGGRCIDCTEEMHASFKDICEQAISALGLTYGGLDFMTKDITSKKSPYIIIEVNSNPFYNMHEKPLVEGKGTDVSFKVLKNIFPELK